MKVSGFAASVLIVGIVGLLFLADTDSRGALVGLVDVVSRVVFWGLLLAACARIAARLCGSRLTGLSHLAWDGAAGLALLIALLLTVGLLPGGFQAGVVRLLVAGVVALGAAAAWSDPAARFSPAKCLAPGDRGVLLLLLTLAVAGLAWDRVPPVFFDARAYHFAFPELWLVTGRVTPESWSVLSWFPPGMPMLYGAGLATGGERFANDANLVVGLCLIAIVADLARRLFGAGSALLAAILTASTPLVFYALAIPGADLAHGLFVLGALGSLLLRDADRPCWLKRAGLMTAGAVLTKYLGLVVPLALGTAWLVAWPSQADGDRSMRARFGRAMLFAAPAVFLFLPWMAANTVALGNPVAPTASSVFPTRGLAPDAAGTFREDTRGGLPTSNDVRLLPSRWFTGNKEESGIYPTPAWGWLPLALVAASVFAARDDRMLRAILAIVVVLLGVWFLLFRWERFLVAAAALVAVASAGGIVILTRRSPALRFLPAAAAVIAAVSVLPSLAQVERFTNGAPVALGRETAAEFIDRSLASERLFRRANALLDPARDAVLLVGEIRHYGLSVPRTAPSEFNTHPLVEAMRGTSSPESVNRTLRMQGFTYLIVDSGWIARSAAKYPSLAFFRDHPEAARSYFGSLGSPVAVEGQVALYRIPD